MQIQPYLFFEGRAEEAAEFYKSKLGAEVTMLMRNKESPEKPPPGSLPPGSDNKVLHMALKIGETTLLISDGSNKGKPDFQGFALSATVKDDTEAKKVFGALADGGQVHVPLAKTFFSSSFGMVADRFGVLWMVYVAQ